MLDIREQAFLFCCPVGVLPCADTPHEYAHPNGTLSMAEASDGNASGGGSFPAQKTADYVKQDTTALERIARLSWERADSMRPVETRIRGEDPQVTVSFERLPKDSGARQKKISELTEFVSIETINEIEASEGRLLDWLEKDSANPLRFFANPLSCLVEAQISLSPRALGEIQRSRQAQMANMDLGALAQIKHLDVRLGSKTTERAGCVPSLGRMLWKRKS